MTSTAHSTHPPALQEPHVPGEVGRQLHWTVVGPLFRPLHLPLDELIDSWRELAGTISERAVAIGFYPGGQSTTDAPRR